MKKLILLFIVGSLFAQYLPPQSDIAKMSSTEKLMLYNIEKKNPALSVFYSIILPSAGHAYSANWKRGIRISSVRIGTYLLSEMFWIDTPNDTDWINTRQDISDLLRNFSIGVFIYEFIDSGREATKYNRKLYENIFGKEPPSFSMNVQPTYQGANLTMSYALD